MQDWGFYRQLNSIPEDDEYCFDEKTRTVIVGTSDMSRINNITRETVEDIIHNLKEE